MKQFIKNTTISLVVISIIIAILSNAAQPGVWNAGGGGYHLLFTEDSLSFKKIQMQSEKISMHLYPGFGVVKGKYSMYNGTSDTIKVKVGYPVHGIYSGNAYGNLNQVTFDGLYKLKALQNGKLLAIIEKPISSHPRNSQTFKNDNWYVWENIFLPQSTTLLEVYFMVNTNNASINKGYNKDRHNAFVYLLESGSVWKQPITRGDFRFSLLEGLQIEDIHGITNLDWKYDETSNNKEFFASKLSFSPTPKNNIVINYGEKIEAFNFEEKTKNAEEYFNAIDSFSKKEVSVDSFSILKRNNPYEVSTSPWVYLLFLIPIVFFGIFLLSLYLLFQYFRKRKLQK